ncbi:MAG: hypothetical protein MI919_24940 [Holophagales bacterium]|nr:hypothetical protein [Holophagales bacterium]
MNGIPGLGRSRGRLPRLLTLLGLGRLARWLSGERPRRSFLGGAPAADALGRAFDLGVAAPLLGLLRISRGFWTLFSGAPEKPERGWTERGGQEPGWPHPGVPDPGWTGSRGQEPKGPDPEMRDLASGTEPGQPGISTDPDAAASDPSLDSLLKSAAYRIARTPPSPPGPSREIGEVWKPAFDSIFGPTARPGTSKNPEPSPVTRTAPASSSARASH